MGIPGKSMWAAALGGMKNQTDSSKSVGYSASNNNSYLKKAAESLTELRRKNPNTVFAFRGKPGVIYALGSDAEKLGLMLGRRTASVNVGLTKMRYLEMSPTEYQQLGSKLYDIGTNLSLVSINNQEKSRGLSR